MGWIPHAATYLLLTTVFGGLFVGRLAALALNGGIAGFPRTIIGLHAIDALGFALSVTAFVIDRR